MKQAILVQGLAFGDEGKGSVVDALTRRYNAKLVVRFNGGCQAGHHVVTPGGKEHTFSQFGAGTLAGAETYLSKHVIIDPIALKNEGMALIQLGVEDPYCKVHVDEDCPVVTPYHRLLNRAKEIIRNKDKHGSCGMGIGEVVSDSIEHGVTLRARDLQDRVMLEDKLSYFQKLKLAQFEKLTTNVKVTPELERYYNLMKDWHILSVANHDYLYWGNVYKLNWDNYVQRHLMNDTVIFEGAQGVLLDQDFGTAPYNTWSDCTFNNAYSMLKNYDGKITRIGLIRSYMTRHGVGPFPTEDATLNKLVKNDNNQTNQWQEGFRVGHLDLVLLGYSLAILRGGIDYLGVNHLDQISYYPQVKVCNNYVEKTAAIEARFRELFVPHVSPMQDQFAATSKHLTEPLFKVIPEYQTLNPKDLLTVLQEHGLTVGVSGYGPTADDKIIEIN